MKKNRKTDRIET